MFFFVHALSCSNYFLFIIFYKPIGYKPLSRTVFLTPFMSHTILSSSYFTQLFDTPSFTHHISQTIFYASTFTHTVIIHLSHIIFDTPMDQTIFATPFLTHTSFFTFLHSSSNSPFLCLSFVSFSFIV